MSAVEQSLGDTRNPPTREMPLILLELFVLRDSDSQGSFLDQCEFTNPDQLKGNFPGDGCCQIVVQLQRCRMSPWHTIPRSVMTAALKEGGRTVRSKKKGTTSHGRPFQD